MRRISLLRRMALILGFVLAIGSVGAGVASASTITDSRVNPYPAPDNCGGSIALTATSYSNGTFKFKMVGTDLDQWLGPTGHGLIKWAAAVLDKSVQGAGNFNASGQSGALSAQQSISAQPDDNYDISVSLWVGNFEFCSNTLIGPVT